MKKSGKLLLLLFAVLALVGCQDSKTTGDGAKEVTRKCTIVNDQQATSGYKVESNVTIYSKNNIVKKVETKEIVTSDQESVLTYFEDYYDAQYGAANETYGGYDYEFKTNGNKLTSTVKIDYTEMNLEKYAKDYAAMKEYLNDNNEFTLEGITKLYESMGATCEK